MSSGLRKVAKQKSFCGFRELLGLISKVERKEVAPERGVIRAFRAIDKKMSFKKTDLRRAPRQVAKCQNTNGSMTIDEIND